jgi:hypothetical protein
MSERCFLVIIPLNNLKDIPEIRHYAKNVLEVDDDFYEEILKMYKEYPIKKEIIKRLK